MEKKIGLCAFFKKQISMLNRLMHLRAFSHSTLITYSANYPNREHNYLGDPIGSPQMGLRAPFLRERGDPAYNSHIHIKPII